MRPTNYIFIIFLYFTDLWVKNQKYLKLFKVLDLSQKSKKILYSYKKLAIFIFQKQKNMLFGSLIRK